MVTDLDMVIFVLPAIGSRFFFSFFLFFFFLTNFLIGGLEFAQETRVNLMQTGHLISQLSADLPALC